MLIMDAWSFHFGLVVSIFLLIKIDRIYGEEDKKTWWSHQPSFGSTTKSLTVGEGNTAKLTCIVYNLNDRSVTWMRKRDLHILTVGLNTYSADDRFQSIQRPRTKEWTLLIRYVQKRDSGIYECQVNTDPKISQPITLSVTGTKIDSTVNKAAKVFVANNTASTKDGNLRVEIIGPRERFIQDGSKLTLTCIVTSLSGPSNIVYWYHRNTLIDYNSPRGGVSLKVNSPKGETIATLLVNAVGPADSGTYSCVPPGSHPASVLVHVQKGEQKAAIHQSGVNTTTPVSSRSIRCNTSPSFIFLLFVLINLIPRYF